MTTVEEVQAAPPPATAPPKPSAGSKDSDGPPLRPNPGFVARVRAMFRRGERKFDGPVAWLLGRQMMGSMKGLLLYSAYGKKLDPRDWMTARAFSFDPDEKSKTRPPEGTFFDPPEGLTAEALRASQKEKGGFWFDYISDTGDGMRATYSIAYLALCNLTVEGVSDPSKAAAGALVTPVREGAGRPLLPRGDFLFVGGDTAYHASDYMTLTNRIYTTFKWAYDDAVHDRVISPDAGPRPIYGIPGNHDYYDQLDGFRRQFRRPPMWEPEPPYPLSQQPVEAHDTADTAQLILAGYYRTQEASYLALRLPYDWVLWGLDTEVGQIDERQKDFFHQFCRLETRTAEQDAEGIRKGQKYRVIAPPDRLIVATCSPTTFFGKLADPEDYKSADAFGQLGIEQPFLPKEEKTADGKVKGWRRGDPLPDLEQLSGDRRLRKGQCRLDLSGDVHHYARYWGPRPPAGSVPTREGHGHRPKAQAPRSDSYASVVSGIGGAFHHPSETYVDEVREQSLYPSETTSTDVVSRSIFKFWNIWTGGAVYIAGALVAFIIYFAFAVSPSSRQFLHNLPHFGLGLASGEQVQRMVVPLTTEDRRAELSRPLTPAQVEARNKEIEAHNEAVAARNKQVRADWNAGPGWKLWRGLAPPTPCDPSAPPFYFGPCKVPTPDYFWIQILIGILSPAPLFIGAFVKRLYEKEKEKAAPAGARRTAEPGGDAGTTARASSLVMTPEGLKIKPGKVDLESYGEPGRALIGLCLLAAAMFFIGPIMVYVSGEGGLITPFNNSLMVLATVIWAAGAVALTLRYSEFLFNKSQHREERISWKDWVLPWVLSLAALAAVGFGLWAYGQNNAAALLISDALFVLVVVGLGIGLIWGLPFRVGAELFSTKRKSVRVLGKLLVGFWHFLLQVSVPLVLVRKGSLLLWVVVALAVALATWLGGVLLRKGSGPWLAFVWFALGGLTLVLPFLLPRFVPGHWMTRQWFAGSNATGWDGLWPTVIAAVVGAVMCCVWFGWYLGVCFAFNGHNNEVGGAARIERFKQFIRFHLTEHGLTGYVIAVNDPAEKGSDLTPHLVDVFHLKPKATDY